MRLELKELEARDHQVGVRIRGEGGQEGNGLTGKRIASCRHRAGVTDLTGSVIAGYTLYAGTVICFSAAPGPEDDPDPPHPPSRRAHTSQAPDDLLITESVDAGTWGRPCGLRDYVFPACHAGGRSWV